jgi:hypothetical protein
MIIIILVFLNCLEPNEVRYVVSKIKHPEQRKIKAASHFSKDSFRDLQVAGASLSRPGWLGMVTLAAEKIKIRPVVYFGTGGATLLPTDTHRRFPKFHYLSDQVFILKQFRDCVASKAMETCVVLDEKGHITYQSTAS